MSDPQFPPANTQPRVPLPRRAERALPLALLRAREAVMVRFRPMLARHGVTEQQWRVIRALGESGPQDASSLAEKAFVLPPSLTRIVKALEESRLIVRARDDSDGRRAMFALSAAGHALIAAIVPESQAIYNALEQKFGIEKIEALLDMLDALAAVKEEGGGKLASP